MNHSDLKPGQMEIKILGPGCSKCRTLANNTQEAVKALGLKANIIKVDDIMEIMKFGVMTTPALVINDKIVVKGKAPSVSDIVELLKA